MSVAFIPAPVPIYDYIVSGPYPPYISTMTPVYTSATEFALGAVGGYMPQRDTNSAGRPIWTHVSNGAGGTQVQAHYKGVQAREMTSGAGAARVNNALEGINMMPVTDASGLDPGYLNPSWRRVSWFRFSLALGAGSQPDDQTGVLLTLLASGAFLTTNFWPTAPSVTFTAGFGIIGDGAGSWTWESYDRPGPPNPVIESVSLAAAIPDAEDWTQFDYVFTSAAGGRLGTFGLYINDALFLTRNFVDAPALIGLGNDAGFDNFKYTPIIQVGPLVAGPPVVYFGDWEFRMGRFLPGGLELTT